VIPAAPTVPKFAAGANFKIAVAPRKAARVEAVGNHIETKSCKSSVILGLAWNRLMLGQISAEAGMSTYSSLPGWLPTRIAFGATGPSAVLRGSPK
jgi:hypothetical protein